MSAFTLIAEFEASPGEEERLRHELAAMVEPTLAEDGCLGSRPYVDPADPASMIIVEEWADTATLDRHFQTAHFRRVFAALDDILARPFTLTTLIRSPEPATASRP